MDIENLRTFITVATAKSYTAAARQLYVTQPTLSRRIKTLEDELGCKLVYRTAPLSLTPAGKQLINDVSIIVQSYDDLRSKATLLRRAPEEVIKIQDISLSPTFLGALARREKAFGNEFPGVVFSHVECPMGIDLPSIINEGIIDICFAYVTCSEKRMKEPPSIDGIDFVEFIDMRGQLCLALSKDNPVLNKPHHCIQDFQNIKFMSPLIRFLDLFRDSFKEFCIEEGDFTPTFDFRSIDKHRYFYSEDVGNSAFIIGRHTHGDGRDGMVPLAMMEDMEIVSLENCITRTFAMYSNRASESVREFAKQLGESLLEN